MKKLFLTLITIIMCTATITSYATKAVPKHNINVNEANEKQLSLLPGIGPKKAAAILKNRKNKGCFKRLSELQRVKGVGSNIIKMMEKKIADGKLNVEFSSSQCKA